MSRASFRNSLLLGFSLTLVACATQQDQKDVVDAATVPLQDLHLVHADIPAPLVEAQRQPYAIPADTSCTALLAQVRDLDAALGPDLDAPDTDEHPSLIERGTKEAKKAAVGAIRGTTESVLPFRNWVRKLSGAERYSKKVAAAIAAGTIRRAFLKGLIASRTCESATNDKPAATQ